MVYHYQPIYSISVWVGTKHGHMMSWFSITNALISIHWLRVPRYKVKVAVLTYKVSLWAAHACRYVRSQRSLHSATLAIWDLLTPTVKLLTPQQGVFSCCGSQTWKNIPTKCCFCTVIFILSLVRPIQNIALSALFSWHYVLNIFLFVLRQCFLVWPLKQFGLD